MKHAFVLGVHPSSRGFGWALFEGPLVPFDWGTVDARANKNETALSRFAKLLDRYEPRTLAIEAFDDGSSRRSARVRTLSRNLIGVADARGIAVRVYTRSQIGRTLTGTDAPSRDDIAASVAERVAILHARLPEPRKSWLSEHPSIALFQAAACALTYLLGPRC